MSEDKKQEWSRAWISNKLEASGLKPIIFAAYIKDTPEKIMYYDELLVDIVNKLNTNKTDAITKAILFALPLFRDYLYSEDGSYNDEYLSMLDKAVEDTKANVKSKYVQKVYGDKGTEKAREAAAKLGVDFDSAIEVYTMPINNNDKSPVIRKWLKDYFSDRDSQQVSRIKADMIDDAIIDPTDWDLVKNIASTDGYSKGGKRGIWQKVS